MFGLTFLAPLFLAGALAAAVPVVLHLLRREEAPELELATTRFIKQAPVPRAKRRRLRDLMLLALRVAALVLIAGAFARPFFAAASGAVRPTLMVVAIDTSFSMGGTARETEARRLAAEAVAATAASVPVAVVAFDDEARVLAEATTDRGLARAAIEQARVGFGGTNYQALTAVASALFGDRAGELVVVTDLQRVGWRFGRGSLPEDVAVRVTPVEPMPTNVSVSRVAHEGDRIVASITNHGSTPVSTEVSLRGEGASTESKPVTISGGRTIDVAFERNVPRAGAARVTLVDPQGLPADDERHLLLDPPAPVPVVVVAQAGTRGDQGYFVAHALAASGPGRPLAVRTIGGAAEASARLSPLSATDLVLIVAARGLDRNARVALSDHVVNGGRAFLALGPQVDLSLAAEFIGAETGLRIGDSRPTPTPLQMSPVDTRHPLFQAFGDAAPSLTRVSFSRVLDVQPGRATVLARFSDGRPALLEVTRGKGRLLVLASDLDGQWNDFPRRAAFVPFLQEVVRYLTPRDLAPREVSVAEMPAGLERKPGVFRAPGSDVNLVANVSVEESTALVASAEEFQAEIDESSRAGSTPPRSAAEEQEEHQMLWRYGLWFAVGVLVLESLWGRFWT